MSDSAEESPTGKRGRRRKFRLLPRTRRGRIITVSALVVVLAGAATGTWYLLSRPAETPQALTQTITVSPTTLKTTVSATGTLQPERQADLTFDASSTVTSVDVSVGDTVTEGQQLATIDDSSLELALDSAQADLTAAQENLADLEDSDDATDAHGRGGERAGQDQRRHPGEGRPRCRHDDRPLCGHRRRGLHRRGRLHLRQPVDRG